MSEYLLSNSYDPKKIESEVRENWKQIDLRKKIQLKFSGKKKVGYVDGPPTLNGEPHMGHLRGRIIKDLWYRFETLRGLCIDFRGGWDCQGLPVELQAEKELGLTGNKTANLKTVGEEALVAECKKMLQKYHAVWRESDERVGLLIDDENAYWTYRDSYIEREWQILKSAWDNEILAEGFRVTPFCPSCQTSLSAAEVALGGYENLEDPSMYFKMKVRGEQATFLIVWTTMPFTVITDELVGAKPDSEYCFVKVQLPQGSETWIVGSQRLEALMKELHIENYSVTKRVKGRELEGIQYEHPLIGSIPRQGELDEENKLVHSIVAEEFVDDTTGSGLVHMSPANGEDDFEVAQKRKIPVFNPIDGQAVFNQDAGAFSGLFVRDADQKVSDALKQEGALLRYGRLKHEYPVCWRSGHRLVYLARREYFYFVDRLKEMAVDATGKVEYYYDQPKNRFVEIVKEKRPWCISRERVWGTPLPIWKCDKCGKKLGLFSRKEIVAKATSLPDGENFELHRPWIDRVTIPCSSCGTEMKREPFVLDTWHNSGAAPYAAHTDKEYDEYIPMPHLTEGIDQTRGWAYSLLIENVLLKMKSQAPYQAFLFQGHVLDEKGEKLSKSKGNFVPVRELLAKNSVDLIRFYLIWKASPIDSLNFSQSELVTRPYQILNTLYHMHVFYLQNASFDAFKFSRNESKRLLNAHDKSFKKQDRWLLSKLGLLIDVCTRSYSEAKYHEAARALERFLIDDLSQTYVPIIRSEMWEETEETKKRRQVIYSVLGLVLVNVDALMHPIAPFLTDSLAGKCFGVEALLLLSWPESMPEYRNEKLEVEFDLLAKTVSLTNAARMKAKAKRRWPLRKAYYLVGQNEQDLILENKDLLLEQTNLSDVELVSDPMKMPIKVSAKPNYELVAPRAKARMNDLSAKLAKADAAWLFKEISNRGKAKLPDMSDFELTQSDIIFTFASSDPKYVVSENYGIVVALDSSRDDQLIAQGIVRDIARNLQALRKEKGFNPTDILKVARVSGLNAQTLALIESKRDELAFLVRVKSVEISSENYPESANWATADIDGTEIKFDIS
ncbi:MAG TPA: isoleucine--tRNA ligase [Nitrososphaerales archaeon]|nr:isoleucine--tRNA ligase [Nitrososphaerales archaeon]